MATRFIRAAGCPCTTAGMARLGMMQGLSPLKRHSSWPALIIAVFASVLLAIACSCGITIRRATATDKSPASLTTQWCPYHLRRIRCSNRTSVTWKSGCGDQQGRPVCLPGLGCACIPVTLIGQQYDRWLGAAIKGNQRRRLSGRDCHSRSGSSAAASWALARYARVIPARQPLSDGAAWMTRVSSIPGSPPRLVGRQAGKHVMPFWHGMHRYKMPP